MSLRSWLWTSVCAQILCKPTILMMLGCPICCVLSTLILKAGSLPCHSLLFEFIQENDKWQIFQECYILVGEDVGSPKHSSLLFFTAFIQYGAFIVLHRTLVKYCNQSENVSQALRTDFVYLLTLNCRSAIRFNKIMSNATDKQTRVVNRDGFYEGAHGAMASYKKIINLFQFFSKNVCFVINISFVCSNIVFFTFISTSE